MLPGWTSPELTSLLSKLFTYLGWIALFALGVFEIFAHVYSEHEKTFADKARDAAIRSAENRALETSKQEAIRDITPDEQKALSDRLATFTGQKAVIDIFPVSFEHHWIASTILGILTNAHWNARDINLLPTPPLHNLASNGTGTPTPFLVQGIWISSTGDDRSQAAAKALFEALKSTITPGGMDHVPLPNPEDPRVWIFVGDKPTPLRSWVK
jgi:hypothetical protein